VPSAFAVLTPRPVWRSFLNGTLTLSAAIMIETAAAVIAANYPRAMRVWPQEERQSAVG